jgi:hypothetical protein
MRSRIGSNGRLLVSMEFSRETAPVSMATEQERAILLEFFNATGGERWKQAHGWNTSANPCEWQGVMCLPVEEDGVQPAARASMRPEFLADPVDEKLDPPATRAHVHVEVLLVHE